MRFRSRIASRRSASRRLACPGRAPHASPASRWPRAPIRRCSNRGTIWTTRWPGCACCLASASGPRITSQCACCAKVMRFWRRTSRCNAFWRATDNGPTRATCWSGPSAGGHGGPTRCCTFGSPRPLKKPRRQMTMASKFRLERFASPIGGMLIVTDNDDMTRAVEFEDHLPRLHQLLRIHYGAYELADASAGGAAIQALQAYFGGDLAAIEAVAVRTEGTAFQRDVWRALRDIPAGQTPSYGHLAAGLGRPGASRAVGLANGSNPVSLIVPCHRVIGANGALTGYGGGIERKRWLLEHERVNRSPPLRSPPAQASGVPVSGVPVSGVPVSGVPVSGVPVSGVPVSGVPVSGVQ